MTTSEDLVTLELENGIATLRLNRANEGNALNLELAKQLSMIVSKLDVDEATRCVLLTGNGRFFCVGGDVGAFKNAGDDVPALLKEITSHLHIAVSRLARMKKPLVVAVNGPAAGAGIGLACIGDIVLAAQSAHFTMAYTTIGLTPDGGATSLLPRLIGLRRTQELTFTNRRVLAPEAVAIGLVTQVVEAESLHSDARGIAETLAAGPTRAFGAIRSLLRSGFDTPLETQLELESREISAAAATLDGKVGIAAFLDKRAAVFKGE